MKKEYNKPAMMVVSFNQQPPLLTVTSSTSTGPSAEYMSNPTISEEPEPPVSNSVWNGN